MPGHSEDAVRGFIGNGSRILIERAAPAGSAVDLIDEIEVAFKKDYDLTWPTGTFVYDGIFEVLAELQGRGHPLAVLSNKPHPFTAAMVATLFPDTRFTSVLGQRSGIAHKPDPGGALEIAFAMGMTPENFSIIGDSTMDIETAKNAGMHAVAVTWGFHDRDRLLAAGADVIVDQPTALPAVFC
jgi:phosphoglycolate phosphatase